MVWMNIVQSTLKKYEESEASLMTLEHRSNYPNVIIQIVIIILAY